MISKHLTEFADHPVHNFDTEKGIEDPNVIYRISVGWDDTDWEKRFIQLIDDPLVGQLHGFVAGAWMGEKYDRTSAFVVEHLVNVAARWPNLHALFIGDMTYEENEISWINQSNLGALFTAYPALTHFGARGGNGLRFGRIDHPNLTHLIVETGGLNYEVVQDILQSNLPNLTHLELWIGTEEYGRSVEIDNFAPLLTENIFPNLRYLGLRNAQIADEIATTLVNAPLLDQIETLDLSLGTLTDAGGRAILNSERVRGLKKLDLHRHYLSQDMMTALRGMPIAVDVSDRQDDNDGDWRFVAVGE